MSYENMRTERLNEQKGQMNFNVEHGQHKQYKHKSKGRNKAMRRAYIPPWAGEEKKTPCRKRGGGGGERRND